MTIGIMQPYFLPYIGYWQLMHAVDTFVIYDDVNYINRGWINRNRILINGEAQMFTLPLIEASQNKLIKDILIVSENKWKEKLLKTIQFNYKKAVYYQNVYPLIEKIIMYEKENISDFIHHSLLEINKYLGIETKVVKSSTIYNNQHLKAAGRIIDICMQEKADFYINPIGGVDLYSKEDFSNNGIELSFIDTKIEIYKQFENNFVPYLSILDVMMFNSIVDIKEMITNYVLK